jgi:membrane associated rhomboid family serine protease
MWNPFRKKTGTGEDGGYEPLPALERRVTLVLLVLNILVFLAEPSIRSYAPEAFEGRYSLSLQGLRAGYVWQFLSFQFLHGNWMHLVTNLVLLHSMGPVLETTLGRGRFLGLYLGSGVIGGLVHVAGAWLSPRFFGHPVVGASAGLCGLLAALGAIYSEERIRGYLFFVIPFQLKAKFLLLFAGVASLVGTVLPFGHIAHLAHLGGLVGGLLCVNLMDVRPLPPETPKTAES